jgi:thiamine-phosphate pyrophosphorylase
MVHGKSSGFTPATERTVQWCRGLLSAATDADDRAALLVLALLCDESLASACLKDFGITEDWLRTGAFGSAVTAVLQCGLPQRLESEGSGCGPQRSLVLEEDPHDFRGILLRARELARQESADQPITSALLLLAIPDQNAFVRERLAEQGATRDILRSRLLPEQAVIMEKLAVDEPLQWPSDATAAAVAPAVSAGNAGLDSGKAGQHQSAFPESAVLRAVDACLNRAREGLRVLEDCARFVWNAGDLCTELKSLRHELAGAEQQLRSRLPAARSLLHARNTPGDVGTAVTDPRERSRGSLQQLVLANARRVQESLRSLEEFGKLLDPDFAAVMKQLRYRSYTIEQQLAALNAQPSEVSLQPQQVPAQFAVGRPTDQRLQRLQRAVIYVLITESQCRLPWLEAAEQALSGGADVLQLREKQLTDRELLHRARMLSQLCRKYDALFIMNDRPDLALATDADGVHVGQEELTVTDIRHLPGWRGLIGVSTHSIQQLQNADAEGADYVGVGPVFPSSTKVFDNFPGLAFVQQAAAAATVPWFPIGGINAERLPELLAAGARRVAVTAAITQSPDPAETTRAFRKLIDLHSTQDMTGQ